MTEPTEWCCDDLHIEYDRDSIERLDDGTWAVNGCCGGGCYVLERLRFCPFCGKPLL